MKRITRLIGIVMGAMSSLFTVGCDRPAEKIYGPPEMLNAHRKHDKIQKVDESKLQNSGKMDAKLNSDLPESDGIPADIYGPPEMLGAYRGNGEMHQDDEIKLTNTGKTDAKLDSDLPESDGIPADIYGPPEMFENTDSSDDEEMRRERDKDFEELKHLNE